MYLELFTSCARFFFRILYGIYLFLKIKNCNRRIVYFSQLVVRVPLVEFESLVGGTCNRPASINRFTILISGNIRVCGVIGRVSCC